jgi:hypothetical protein
MKRQDWSTFVPSLATFVVGTLAVSLVLWALSHVSRLHFNATVVLIVAFVGFLASSFRAFQLLSRELSSIKAQATEDHEEIGTLRLATSSLMHHVMVDVINAATAEGIRYEQYEYGKSQPGWGFRFPDGRHQWHGAITSREDVIRQLREAGAKLEGL